MGIVYKALDTHLDRFVAIKVLPPEKVADAERKRRFVQEAKAASALNHPNIITIHDIASENGIDFIAMEYVPGKALNQLIPRKGLPLSESLKYAIQIADALAAAHAAGIIHRDLKPGNVMVSGAEGRPGLVKVLDFGLAKLTDRTEGGHPEFTEFTETIRQGDAPSTGEGAIVGTISYMSPEQAEGKKVDARSDIFSFGALLYEMVTGQRAFQGVSKLSTLSAILREEPKPASQVVEGLPRELERIIARCLRKSPERRFQAMPDLKVALEELKEESDSGVRIPAVAQQKRAAAKWWKIAATVIVFLLLAGGAALWRMSRPAPEPDQEVTVVPLTAHPGDERDPTFSPDGSQVAFAWGPEGGTPDIYVKLIGPGEPIRLTNTPEDERMPQWSPDGRWIAFSRSLGLGGIVAVPALGGPERMLTREENSGISSYVSWSADSQWVTYCAGTPRSLYLAPLNGGEKKLVLGPLQGKFSVLAGILSPDSRKLALLYTTESLENFRPRLYVVALSADYKPEGEPKPLVPADWNVESPAWTADGKEILFIREFGGGANVGSDTAMYRVVADGGAPRRVSFAGDNPWFLGIARRGSRMAFTRLHRDINIYRVALEANGAIRKTGQAIISSSRRDDTAYYSPDGSHIAFTSNRAGPMEIWIAQADGKDPVQLTTAPDWADVGDPQWSPDGSKIAYVARPKADTAKHIFLVSSSGGVPQALTTDPAIEYRPTWSHDGRWIYFASDRGGALGWNIWKVASSGGPATQVTRSGGLFALESPDRKWLYFTVAGGILRRMPVDGGEETDYVRNLGASRLALGVPPFFVTAKGVYYLATGADQRGALIRFIGHAGGESKTLGSIPRTPSAGLSLSPDGRFLLYSQYDQSAAELLLVENFH